MSSDSEASHMADSSPLVAPLAPVSAKLIIFEGEIFQYPLGINNNQQCCTKCGNVKTPQWREGPYGPKTLCNACGVKRTRRIKAEEEGTTAKRRKLSASPAPPAHKLAVAAPKRSRTLYAQDAPSMDRYGSLEPDSDAWAPLGTQGSGRRPTRRAAEEAAFKTALYARTGEWCEGQDGEASGDMLRAVTPCSDDDDSLLSSDCPEEVVWPPVAGDASGGSDCYAAVNLMTMSVSQAAAAATPGASPASPLTLAPPVPAPPADLEQYGSTATAAVACPPAVASRMGPVDLADLSQVLPPAKVAELVFLNHELELAVHEAHAANAAVAAVAHVLASKQAVALRSREMAGAATKRLRRFMAELDTQFGIQSKFGSRRPPLSPTKPTAAAAALRPCPPGFAAASITLPPVLPPRLPAPPALNAAMF
ncbi:GATA transcription factor 16 [Chlorella vulgaris]